MIARFPYHADYHAFDLEHWTARSLRFEDQFLALCYAYGITFQQVIDYFGPNDDYVCVDQQLKFIGEHQSRTPNRVLEIGAGRGEVSCALKKLGAKVMAVDVAIDINTWSKRTGQQFFGNDFDAPEITQSNIAGLDLDLSAFDTILIIETLEHIHEEDFRQIWDKIINGFHGLFIVTNLVNMHPIPIGGDWPDAELMHCRVIDDALYDTMCLQAKSVAHRRRSHLVLEF